MNEVAQNMILLADDDGDDQLLVRDALAECDPAVGVRFVENGEELLDYLLHRGRFLDAAQNPVPDLILLDLNMPRQDGREALREIRAHPDLRRLPVVVFTTSNADTDVGQIYDLGANSFITKPAEFDRLVRTLGAVVQYWFGPVVLPETEVKSI